MSALSGISSSASDIRTDYLNLLLCQLRNQNPLEPLSNSEMSSQLAQLSQLEQLENISSTFRGVFMSVQLSQAREMIGKLVSFVPDGANVEYWGRVDGVDIVDGEVRLRLGQYSLELSEVRSIRDAVSPQDLLADELLAATDLIGKEVTFAVIGPTGGQAAVTGRVDSATVSDGKVVLKVGDHTVELGDIQAISN